MSAILQSNDLFEVQRFRGRTAAERESQWLDHRGKGVGGSDMGTIMGLNKYSTPYELWLEKTGRKQHEDISGRWPIIKGNLLENELRRWYRRNHPGLKVISGTDVSLTSRRHPHMIASLDGVIAGDPRGLGVLECKTASAYRASDWHDGDGNLIAPPYYMAQVMHYLAVTGFEWGVFVADIGESSPVEVEFKRDEDDIAAVIEAAETFWGFVERDEPPRLMGGDVDTLYLQDDGDIRQVESEELEAMASQYEEIGDVMANLKRQKDDLAGKIKALVGESKGVMSGQWKATYSLTHYKQSVRQAYDTRVLRVTRIKEK
jgi:putative phage-type endonuclease